MNNWVFSFDIVNNQKEYANCLQFIDWFQGGYAGAEICEEFLKQVKYMQGKSTVDFTQIMRGKFKKFAREDINWESDDEIQVVFYVDCTKKYDIVNLIYYCLINDRFGDKATLCIKADNEYKGAANIKDLLSDLLNQNIICNCYFRRGDKYEKVSRNDRQRRVKQFSPIYQIKEEEETVAFWRQPLSTLLLKVYKNVKYGGSEHKFLEDYFLPHIAPKELEKEFPGERKLTSTREEELLSVFSECFCTTEKALKGLVRKRYELWKSEEMFELVRNIPVLAMYIFSISEYFSKGEEPDSLENLRMKIFNARDMTDGLLQILENVYHSENKKGYFCFRVHNNSNERGRGYLINQYKSYMKLEDKKNEKTQNFLEVKVVDYSHHTIPKKFYSNFERRMEEADGTDSKKYKKIKNEAAKIQVKTFFEPKSFWQIYNSISENVVHHYGLQVFDSLVRCYDGYFRVRSQSEYRIKEESDTYCSLESDRQIFEENGIPGTQYDIVIPFKNHKLFQKISLNVNINYTDYLLKKFKTKHTIDFTINECNEILPPDANKKMSFQEKKELSIRKLNEKLTAFEPLNEEDILHFSADKISINTIELFCKTLMLYIAKKQEEQKCYIMITDCSQAHFIEITRMFALFYDKQGVNSLMRGTQIFLSGKEVGEEFLISGTNLGEVIGGTEKLAFARCVHPDCIRILKNMLRTRNGGKTPNEIISIVPFDMISYQEDKPTLFERNLFSVLENDVQSEEFGCKLEKLHVRIGSKIHIRTFYEAELLFHNNYYTSRFAYWLLNEMNSSEIDFSKPITLVGNENYSEMLLNEVKNMLKISKKIDVDYMIYEQKAKEKFRAGKPLSQYRNSQFIFIVPINSTTTTHKKLSGFLKKAIENSLKNTGNTEKTFKFEKNINYGIILISDSKGTENEESAEEKKYWERNKERNEKKKKRNIIKSLIDGEEITYYIEVKADWSTPLQCKDCFPDEDYKKEIPLVETNKESVIPMQAIGIKRLGSKCAENRISEDAIQRLEELSQILIYDHIQRDKNHFSYYFCTEKLWDFPEICENVQKWLRESGKDEEKFPHDDCKVYDIIVAPLHFSNAAFVEAVNNYLFSNAALVLHFDIDKEFRMNVKAKYSNLQQLYDNLCEDKEQRSIINFHYVDDTIISGQTFYRTRSLISSLISEKSGNKVEINIFKTVVLLINRLSSASICNYVSDPKYFLSYFNLNISSMRVNEDACVLCKKTDEWTKLAEQASLNEVYLYWKNKCRKIRCKTLEEYERMKPRKKEECKNRAKQYMFSSHRAKTLLDNICNSCYNDEIEAEIISKLLIDKENVKDIDFNQFVSMLKVLGRPFLSFRRETKEVVFKLTLIILEALLSKNPQEANDNKLIEYVNKVRKKSEDRTKLITVAINRLVELESNYIIRKRNMELIMNYAQTLTDEGTKNEFIINYQNRMKQLAGQSKDFTKCLYLEFLLLYDNEYCDGLTKMKMVSLMGEDEYSKFKRKVYLENTKVIDYGITALADYFKTEKLVDDEENNEEKHLIKALNDTYYLDTMIDYLNFHKVINADERTKVTSFSDATEAEKLVGMIKFQQLYEKVCLKREEEENVVNLKNIFKQMMHFLKNASGAKDSDIIVPYHTQNYKENKYISLGLCKAIKIKNLVNNEKKLYEFIVNKQKFEGNTFIIREEMQGQGWIILKFTDCERNTQDDVPVIYMLFYFENKEKDKLLHSLKNLLVFRNKIWQVLNLSSSTLLKSWAEDLFYKQQMLKARASEHCERTNLEKQLDELCKKKEISDRTITANYLELIINSMIGGINTQVLASNAVEYTDRFSYTLGDIWQGDSHIFNMIAELWELEICFVNEEKLEKSSVKRINKQVNKVLYPQITILRIIFLAALQNAYKHGEKEGDTPLKIHIYREKGGILCIANEIKKSLNENVYNDVTKNAYREGKGISKAVIYDVCCGWYQNIEMNKMFQVCKNADQSDIYVVKLPILESESENL